MLPISCLHIAEAHTQSHRQLCAHWYMETSRKWDREREHSCQHGTQTEPQLILCPFPDRSTHIPRLTMEHVHVVVLCGGPGD